jgi:hypothetical protein
MQALTTLPDGEEVVVTTRSGRSQPARIENRGGWIMFQSSRGSISGNDVVRVETTSTGGGLAVGLALGAVGGAAFGAVSKNDNDDCDGRDMCLDASGAAGVIVMTLAGALMGALVGAGAGSKTIYEDRVTFGGPKGSVAGFSVSF